MFKRVLKNKWFYILALALLVASISDYKDTSMQTFEPSVDAVETLSDKGYLADIQSLNHTPTLKGGRKLGIGITEGGVGFEAAFIKAQEMGVEVVEIVSNWDDGEEEPGQYSDEWLEIANIYYSTHDIALSLSINPIDTNNIRLPKHLNKLKFNDPVVIDAYKKYVTYLAKLVPDVKIESVAVGNEVSAVLGTDKVKWQEYTDFFCNVVPHIHEAFPQSIVGVKVPFREHVGEMVEEVKTLNDCADVVLTTYYPLTADFLVEDPTIVHEDFSQIVKLYPIKDIYFLEIGYPSGIANGSSEEKQALFFKEALVAWDTHKNRIVLLNILWLHDLSPEKLSYYKKYYRHEDPAFLSYLGTLGVRTYNGESKQAFDILVEELSGRGW